MHDYFYDRSLIIMILFFHSNVSNSDEAKRRFIGSTDGFWIFHEFFEAT